MVRDTAFGKQRTVGHRRRDLAAFLQQNKQLTPAAVTTFGELGEGCVMVQEWLAMRDKAHLSNQPERPDGVKVATLVGNFRADFRLALIMTVVRRAAAMQLGSGLPSGSIRGSYGLTNLDSEGSA